MSANKLVSISSGFEDLAWLFHNSLANRGVVRLNFDEAALLWKVTSNSAGAILEIGRRHGGSTVLLLQASGVRHVYSVDLRPQHHRECEKVFEQFADRLSLIIGHSHHVSWETPIGLLFIDGDHSAVGVQGDVRKYWPWLRPTDGRPALAVIHDALPAAGGIAAVIETVERLQSMGVARKKASAGSLLVLDKLTELPPNWPN